ncbi:MAG: M18 family aminopeptidase [Gammaproteobacteria bacterium]|nr:M18 family aminopeptidase [Gammaproteobacteria bacterium]
MNTQVETYNQGLLEFIARASSPFHAVREMCLRLQVAGFERLEEASGWALQNGARYFLTRNDSSIIVFTMGREADPLRGLRMVGAHTDSPCLMVKPNPEKESKGYRQLGVEVYGGALLNPWFDRDLSIAGRVTFVDSGGCLRKELVDFRKPIAVIPSLAIHLDREANKNRSVTAQTDIVPLLQQGDEFDIRSLLAQQLEAEYGITGVDKVLEYELCFYDTQLPQVVGLAGEFIASARLDNLLSCYAGLQAIIESDGVVSSLLVCNDHEEVGSMSAAGAQGPMLDAVLRRLSGSSEQHAAMIDRSFLISADNAHAVHPNYASRHDENHGPLLNGGPVIKTNANQRYASNSETAALFRLLCQQLDIPVQSFVVRSDMACGSTIGPITAGEIGVRTLDIGVPQFAMHSVRELTGSLDPWRLAQVLKLYMEWREPLRAQPV